jgi:hypothetical protein
MPGGCCVASSNNVDASLHTGTREATDLAGWGHVASQAFCWVGSSADDQVRGRVNWLAVWKETACA